MFNSNVFRRKRQASGPRNWTKDRYFKLYKNQWKEGRPFLMSSYVFNDDNGRRTFMYKGDNSIISAVSKEYTAVYVYVEEKLYRKAEKCGTLLHLSNVSYDIYRMVKTVKQYIHPTSHFFLLRWDPINAGVHRLNALNHWIEDDLSLFPVSDVPAAERV